MKKILSTILIVATIAIPAVAARIRGHVYDSAQQALVGVTTQILQFPDSTRKAYMITNAKGYFNFNGIKPGNYTLKLTMVGMDDMYKNFSVQDTTNILNLGNLVMTETATNLQTAVVTGIKTAVVAKQDTIEFNAGSFKTQANASVEDLLKKLPGVEVDADGKITSGGKSISKILVDGKEFFGSDTQMATKNLPSELVDKVQVVDRKSDLARLTGVDDGEEETIINLSIKKGMKNGWFGNLGAGAGTDGRYEGKMNISTFTDNNQFSIVGGGNNINDLGFGDSGRGRFSGFGGGQGITTAQRLGVNFSVGKTEDFRVGGNVFYAHSDKNSETDRNTINLFSDFTQTSKSNSKSWDEGHNVNGDFRMEWKMDKNNTLDFRPSFSLNVRDAESSSWSNLFQEDGKQINKDVSRRYNNGTNYDLGGRLIYVHNFTSKPGRSVSVNGNYEFSNNRQHNTSWNDIEYYLLSGMNEQDADKNDSFYRFLDNRQWNNNVGARLTYTEPIGDSKNGNFLQIAYRMNTRFNNANKNTYALPLPAGFTENMVEDLTSIPANAVFVDSLSNQYSNSFYSHEVQIGYKKVNKKYNLETGISWLPSGTESQNYLNHDKDVSRWVWTNVAPYARFQYKFDKTTSLRFDYRGRTSQPSLNQLQPVADVADPLNITIGNPNLKPSFRQSFGINFNNFGAESQRSFALNMRGDYSINDVVSKTVVDRTTGGRTTTYENADGNMNIMGMAMINQPFWGKKFRYSLRMMGNYSSTAGYLNGLFNRSGSLNLRPSVGLTFTNDLFQISFNPTYGYQLSTSTLKQQASRETNTYGFRGDAALTLPFGLSLNSDIDFRRQSGMTTGMNADSWLWNAQLSYSVLSGKNLTFTVRAYDILGLKKNYNRSVSDAMIVDTSTNDLTRYVMFGVAYTFNTMRGKKKPDAGDDFMDPHNFRRGPGGPGGMGGMRRPH